MRSPKKQSGMILVLVLLFLALGTTVAAISLKRSISSMDSSSHEALKMQVALQAFERLSRVRAQLSSLMEQAVVCHSDIGPDAEALCANTPFPRGNISPANEATWQNTWVARPILTTLAETESFQNLLQSETTSTRIQCVISNDDPRSCQWNRKIFPKVFRVTTIAKSPSKNISAQYTATMQFAPESLRNIAYLVTSESSQSVRFSDGNFRGRVGVIFDESTPIESREIIFAPANHLRFQEVFFTNISPDRFEYPSIARPQFLGGIAESVSNYSQELATQFVTLSQSTSLKPPKLENLAFEYARVTIGKGADPCYLKMEYYPFRYANGGTKSLQAVALPSNTNTIFEGSVSNNSVLYAPTSTFDHTSGAEGGMVIERGPINKTAPQLCESNFTLITNGDVKLRTPVVKAPHLTPTQGNVAFVSLQGSRGVMIDPQTRTLLNNGETTFENLISQAPQSTLSETTFQVDAALVALGSSASAPYISPALSNNSQHAHLGTLVTNAGLIGSRSSPTRTINTTPGHSMGAVVSGFDQIEMNFNEGALASPPPGFSESIGTSIGSILTNISLQTESIEDALTALEENP